VPICCLIERLTIEQYYRPWKLKQGAELWSQKPEQSGLSCGTAWQNPQACFETNMSVLFQPTTIKIDKLQSAAKHTGDLQHV